MKKSFLFSVVALAALAAVSCQQEQPSAPASGSTFTVNAQILDEDGKTYLDGSSVKWGKGEYLTLYYNDGSDKFAKSLASSADSHNGSATASFDFNISPASASSYTLGGLYPSSAVTASQSASNFEATLPAVQSGKAGAYDPAAFIMVARRESVSSIPNPWTAYFRRAAALNQLTITGLSSNINAVEITAEGQALAGARKLNISTGEFGAVSSASNTITVNYATALSSSAAVVYFTSWNASIASGSKMTIKVSTAAGIYSKTITAGANGIKFTESKLNKLTVNFSGIQPAGVTLKDFASAFATALDAWKANVATDKTVGVTTFSGHYVPENFTITVGANTYNMPKMYEISLLGLEALDNGGTLNDAIPAPHNYSWSANPYNEGAGNGGEFQNLTVDYNFLLNYKSRGLSYAKSNNVFSNFCNYTDESGNIIDKGTPSVAGKYAGVCCLSRNFLIMARFYKYLIDNNINSGIPAACASMALDAALFEDLSLVVNPTALAFDSNAASKNLTISATESWTASSSASWATISKTSGAAGSSTVAVSVSANTGSSNRTAKITVSAGGSSSVVTVTQNAKGNVTISDFAKAFVGILDIWENTTTTGTGLKVGDTYIYGHYVPANTTITVGGVTYKKTDMYDVAIQSMYKLLGGSTMSESVPKSNNYKWPSDPYYENHNFPNITVSLLFLQNFASRMLLWVEDSSKGNGTWSNNCYYGYGDATSKGTPQVSGYIGNHCIERNLLELARWFKYILDNNYTSDIKNKMSGIRVSYDLFNEISMSSSGTSNPYTQTGVYTTAAKLGQKTSYSCGAHSLMQCFHKLSGQDFEESTIMNWAGTTSQGTGHDGMITAVEKFAKQCNLNCSITWYYYSQVSNNKKRIGEWMEDPNTAMFFHIIRYEGGAAHYEVPYEIDLNSTSLKVCESCDSSKKQSDGSYLGYIDTRTWTKQNEYVNRQGLPQVIVLRKY
ncbi:MAG: hypothetical protein IJU69_07540 [Bacteroidales bacterium]|nr:hypothetical protein [Bacteroidales bacterium]